MYVDHGQNIAQSTNAMARKWWLKAALQEDENAINNLKMLDEQEGKQHPPFPVARHAAHPKQPDVH